MDDTTCSKNREKNKPTGLAAGVGFGMIGMEHAGKPRKLMGTYGT